MPHGRSDVHVATVEFGAIPVATYTSLLHKRRTLVEPSLLGYAVISTRQNSEKAAEQAPLYRYNKDDNP
jgi:hypothetical protein